jgi:nucleotide-binding universal stress UspA family protein
LLRRATRLARATGSELQLFHAHYDPSLELSLFSDREEVNREKERVANGAATQLAELALQIGSEDLVVSHEVRWDHPPADAVLRKIDDSKPDLVMKQTNGPNYIMGLADHSDWELIRRSPAHFWFVKEGAPDHEQMLTAIGETAHDYRVFTPSDYEIFELGNSIARILGMKNNPAHCYQVPHLSAFATYAPALSGVASVNNQHWEEVASMHGHAIEEFAERTGVDQDQILVSRGHPAEALPELARELSAGLIVMSARNLNRWQRFFNPVTAEPVLSEAPCDVLFVKNDEDVRIPEAAEEIRRGVPVADLEMAITNPENAFKTPQEVAESSNLTPKLRERILDLWDLDIRAQMTLDDEGGPVQSSKSGLLREIKQAKSSLAESDGHRRAG